MRPHKRFIGILLVLTLLLMNFIPGVASAQVPGGGGGEAGGTGVTGIIFNLGSVSSQGTVVVDSGNGVEGGTVRIPVRVEDISDLAGYQFEIHYDSSVGIVTDIEQGDFLSGELISNLQEAANGEIVVAAANDEGAGVSGSGTLCTLVFDLVGHNNDFSTVNLHDLRVFNANAEEIQVTFQHGQIEIGIVSSDKQVLSFAFAGLNPVVYGNINGNNISVTVPAGTDLSSLVPTITISDHATVEPASGVAQNFTNPVTYRVTAQDGSRQDYTVSVSVAPAAPVYNVLASFKVGQTANAQILEGGKVLEAQVTVSAQAGAKNQEVLLILALYDGDRTMVNMSYISRMIPAGGSESFHAGFLLPDDVSDYTAKAMVWQGSDLSNTNMVPISNVVQIEG